MIKSLSKFSSGNVVNNLFRFLWLHSTFSLYYLVLQVGAGRCRDEAQFSYKAVNERVQHSAVIERDRGWLSGEGDHRWDRNGSTERMLQNVFILVKSQNTDVLACLSEIQSKYDLTWMCKRSVEKIQKRKVFVYSLDGNWRFRNHASGRFSCVCYGNIVLHSKSVLTEQLGIGFFFKYLSFLPSFPSQQRPRL